MQDVFVGLFDLKRCPKGLIIIRSFEDLSKRGHRKELECPPPHSGWDPVILKVECGGPLKDLNVSFRVKDDCNRDSFL